MHHSRTIPSTKTERNLKTFRFVAFCVVLVLVIASVLGVIFLYVRPQASASPPLEHTDSTTISNLYQMLFDVHHVFEAFEVPYFVIGGTLLGCVRHQGIIPWDDDIDIGIMKKDVPQLQKLRPLLSQAGYRLSTFWFGYKICSRRSFPFLDIFVFDESRPDAKLDEANHLNTKTFCYASRKARRTWPHEYWSSRELFPLQKYKFGCFEVWGPQKHVDYLNRSYGKSWDTVAWRDYDHKKNTRLVKTEILLTPDMRQPALPVEVRDNPMVIRRLVAERKLQAKGY